MASSFTWSTRRDGNSGYVFETHPDGSTVEFGPMPCNLVLNFIAGRRTFIFHQMRTVGFTVSTDPTEWKYLQ